MEKENLQYVENLKREYSDKEYTKLDELKALDRQTKMGPSIFAFSFGIIGALILGLGMTIAMGLLVEDLMWLGILIGVVGIIIVSVNYFIYSKMLKKAKEKNGSRILELSNEILNNK